MAIVVSVSTGRVSAGVVVVFFTLLAFHASNRNSSTATQLALSSVTLNDGHEIPILGAGVFRVPPGDDTYLSVQSSLALGYRHIDTAQFYRNEEAVGRAIIDSGIPREEIFLTTKMSAVFTGPVTYNETLEILHASLAKLQTDYVDLYLIHSPRDIDHRVAQWEALIEAKATGLARSIGVSDYTVAHLQEISGAAVLPAVLQIEMSPWLTTARAEEIRFCAEHGIVVEAWGVLATGKKFETPELQQVAARYGKTPADVLLRWSLQQGFVPLVTSQSAEHQAANLAIATDQDWQLDDADLEALDTLGGKPFFSNGADLSSDFGGYGTTK